SSLVVFVLFALTAAVAACNAVLGIDELPRKMTGDDTDGGLGQRDSGGADRSGDGPRGDSSGDARDGAGGCMSGGPREPAKVQSGVTVCTDAGPSCVSTGATVNGTDCDVGSVCKDGACVKCADGMACGAAGSCKHETIVCSTGSPVCTVSGNLPNGTSCGMNL